MKSYVILFCALLCSGVDAWAQATPGRKPLFDFKKKTDEQTKAKAAEAAKKIIEAVPDDVKNQAKEMITSPEAEDLRKKALQAAGSLMRSDTQSPAAPATGAEPDAPATQAAAKPAVVDTPPPTGPQAQPLQPLNLDEAPAATKGQIVVTAQKSAFFDANLGYGIYVGDVKVRHPQMYLECEELELYMVKKNANGKDRPPPAAKDADILAPTKKSDEEEGPPIDKADARGPMVTVEKRSEEGELQIGHCKHLIYDGKTQNTTLLIWPQVQIGNKLHKSTEAGCIMIIDKKGKLSTSGGNETIILQGEDATPKSRAGASPSGSSPPQQ